jgi:hypothetical protein
LELKSLAETRLQEQPTRPSEVVIPQQPEQAFRADPKAEDWGS